MSIADIFRINKIKAELNDVLKERDELKTILQKTGQLELAEIQKEIINQRNVLSQEYKELKSKLDNTKSDLENQLSTLNVQIMERKSELIVLEEDVLLQSFGFYKPRYELLKSDLYKDKLEEIRFRQGELVKGNKAAVCPASWTVNNSKKEGERMIKDYTKLIVRSFNNECDASITNIKFNNIESIEKKIRKAFEVLNKLGQRMNISLTNEYLQLKIEELYLCYEYQEKKQEEKEELRRLKEQMREEAALLKEIEEQKLKIDKEERHFRKALSAIEKRLQKTASDSEKSILEEERIAIIKELDEIDKTKHDIEAREQNTRAGYVYVISNIGAFGENVYKIGVTRRLDPEDRVYELGDASVPFRFDIHAMVFCEDAPSLENALHKAFDNQRINMINSRREFFKVSLDEIEKVIKDNFRKPIEINRLAEASEYRQSLKLSEQIQ
jgi:hypothetical protein